MSDDPLQFIREHQDEFEEFWKNDARMKEFRNEAVKMFRDAELLRGADSDIQKACPPIFHIWQIEETSHKFCPECGERLFS